MRSRREEYIERFEELTKQEIKNYNDSLLATHMAMEEFRGKLKDCVDVYAQQVAHLFSQIKAIESENIDLKKAVNKLSKNLESQIHDFNKLEKEKIENARDVAEFKEWAKKETARQYNNMHQLNETVNDCTFMMKRRVEDVSQEVRQCYKKTKADNVKLKEEILSLPSEAEKVKEELLKKSAISAIDNAGIEKDLKVIKKREFVQEKMNEYFHTQIDRLKERIES